MSPLSRWFSFGLLVLYVPVFLWLGISEFLEKPVANDSMDRVYLFANLASTVVCLAFFVNMMRVLYLCWKAIQDGKATTTPGKAVGFLFIPIYNLYWMFLAYGDYARDYNEYIERYNIGIKRLPVAVFISFCIFSLLEMASGIGVYVATAYDLADLGNVTAGCVSLVSEVLLMSVYMLLFISYNRLVATERHKKFMYFERLRKYEPQVYREKMKELEV